MAFVDPYSLCPCGSGEKFKWCCHKVEAYADRSQKLYEGGQIEQAVAVLDDGLKKEPGNAWLLTRKALILTRAGRADEAKATVRLVLDKQPKHLGALILMTRLVLETEGPSPGAAQLQQAMSAFRPEGRPALAGLIKVVGAFLSESGDIQAAFHHLRLAVALNPGEKDPAVTSTLRVMESNPAISPWLKNQDELSPAPEGLAGDARVRFDEARAWASSGLWSSAAAAFETLSDDPVAGLAATRNLGFCRLWIADDAGAVAALHRYAAWLGNSTEAVDIEALCQQIEPERPDDLVEQVQLTWPLRDRDALLDALKSDVNVHAEEPAHLDPEAEDDAPLYDSFTLLDKPDRMRGTTGELPDRGAGLTAEQIPLVEGRVLVGKDTAVLETYDDGRLDRLQDRFTALAGTSLAPAHPRTKVLGKVARLRLALAWEWLLPDGIDETHSERLNREQGVRLIREVWPHTPCHFFKGRTPQQVAKAGDAEVPLRAALMVLENTRESWGRGFDFAALRRSLGVPPEPPIDPETVDVARLHLSRLAHVPADRLADDKLVTLYRRARAAMLTQAVENAARALVDRPSVFESGAVETIAVYADLSHALAARGDFAEARDWIEKGRQADPVGKRGRNAPAWDILDLRLRAGTTDPQEWVPELAVLLDRYHDNQDASQVVMMNLVDMGLLEMVPNPDRPGEILIDPRRLQMLLAEYGPRVTTASGRLGVSATRPDIWTPGSQAGGGGGGGIWTPGSQGGGGGDPGGGEKKLIIPGR